MKKINQNGFGALEGLLIFIIVVVIGFAGWYVWTQRDKDESVGTNQKNTVSQPKNKKQNETYKVPEGYMQYENKELGFSFAYPSVYGGISERSVENSVRIFRSDEPSVAYGPGIHGPFMIYGYDSNDASIVGHKYGPTIKLENNRWIVTEANDADPAGNTVGSVYKNIEGKAPDSQLNGKLQVFTLISKDEGSEMYRIAFVSGGKLYEISLPIYSDGLYATDNSQVNDKKLFNEMLHNVRNSVRAL